MNIFFIGSIRGGRAHQPQYEFIVKKLKLMGTVFSGFISDENLSEYGETNIADSEILARELEALGKCDVVVAEVTTPSLGVGYLIAQATSLSKSVIALYFGEDTLKLSAMIKGDQKVEIHAYKTDEDIGKILRETIKS